MSEEKRYESDNRCLSTKNNSMRSFITITFLIIVAALRAQNATSNILYLHNGSILYGKATTAAYKVQMRMSDGSVLIFLPGDIDSVREEPERKAILRDFHTRYYRHDRGYRNITELQLSYGTRPADYYYYASGTDDIGLSIHTVNGYQVWPYLFVGAGVGVDRLTSYRQTFIPVYGRISSEFLKKRVTPYVYADGGYAWMVADNVSSTDGYSSYHREGGAYVTAGGGVRIYTRSRASVMISAGYRRMYSHVRYSYLYDGSTIYDTRRTYQRMVLSVGVSF